jgi:hypothetical protein
LVNESLGKKDPTMKQLLLAIAFPAKCVGRALALPFIDSPSPSMLQACARWGLHVLCMLGVVAGLGYLNHSLHLDRLLLTPFPALRNWWLPIVFVQLYGISWLAWWLVRMLARSSGTTAFADLQRAWQRVESGLVHAGIDARQKPLYLLLGKPAAGAAAFLKAGQIPLQRIGASTNDTEPFQVYATEEALFVSCDETSLLGMQSEMLHQAARVAAESPNQRQALRQVAGEDRAAAIDLLGDGFSSCASGTIIEGSEAGTGVDDTASWDLPDYTPGDVPSYLAGEVLSGARGAAGGAAVATGPATTTGMKSSTARTQTREALQLVEANIALLADEAVGGAASTAVAPRVKQGEPRVKPAARPQSATYQPTRQYAMPLLQDASLIAQTSARLTALCQLLGTLRRPFCPVNGIVVLVPFGCAQDTAMANHTGMLIEADLQTIADATLIDAPRIAVFCDLQTTVGCTEMLARFPEQQRHRRLGIKLPRIAACDRSDMDAMIRRGTSWLCEQLIPPIINRLFVVDPAMGAAGRNSNAVNQRLFEFMETVRQRKEAIERVLRRGFQGDAQPSELLRGCYFAATGEQAVTEQGFVSGILSQVVEMQDEVKWTQAAKQQDAECQRWTVMGYAALAIVACATGLLCAL